jgi:hypothetical protein
MALGISPKKNPKQGFVPRYELPEFRTAYRIPNYQIAAVPYLGTVRYGTLQAARLRLSSGVASFYRELAEVTAILDLLSESILLAQRDFEPASGHFAIALLTAYQTLYLRKLDDGSDHDEEPQHYNTIKVFPHDADCDEGSSSQYHNRQFVTVKYDDLSSVAKEVWKRLLWAFRHWLDLEHMPVTAAEEELDDSDDDDDDDDVVPSRASIKGLPQSILIPALLDPRSQSIMTELVHSDELKRAEKLIQTLFIETETYMRSEKQLTTGAEVTVVPAKKKRKKNAFEMGGSSSSHSQSPGGAMNRGDKEMMDKYASGWQGAGGDATHKRAPLATLADIKAGLEAYDCYLAAVRELDLKLFLSTDKEWSSEEKNSLNPQGQGYDSSFAFENIAIMDWVLTALSNEAAKITVAIYINMKAANAMVERFFSIVGLLANSRNMRLKDDNIEMRAVVRANLDLINKRLDCLLDELRENRVEIPFGCGSPFFNFEGGRNKA